MIRIASFNVENLVRPTPRTSFSAGTAQSTKILVNHVKSQSGGGGAKRKRQAKAVRQIVNELVQGDAHVVVVVRDLNEGPAVISSQAPNLARLFKYNGPLIDCYSLPGFGLGTRPGTFDSCVLRNRFD